MVQKFPCCSKISMSIMVCLRTSFPIISRRSTSEPSGQCLRLVPPFECWSIKKDPQGVPKCQSCIGLAASLFNLLKDCLFKMSYLSTLTPPCIYSTGSRISHCVCLFICSVKRPFPEKISRNAKVSACAVVAGRSYLHPKPPKR